MNNANKEAIRATLNKCVPDRMFLICFLRGNIKQNNTEFSEESIKFTSNWNWAIHSYARKFFNVWFTRSLLFYQFLLQVSVTQHVAQIQWDAT